MRAVEIPAFGIDSLRIADRPESTPGRGQVLVAVKAVSLNYRDLMTAEGQYNPRLALPRIPCSDAAGEVLAVGEGVTSVAVGDRVCGAFMQNWEDGPLTEPAVKSALGGDVDGVLCERVVFNETGVVPVPPHLSFEEAATLPCAGVTAWNALTGAFEPEGKTVLVQGTGGVSVFALQLAQSLGARVLITSGNDDKLERALALGVDAGTNYRTHQEWDKWAREKTGGAGVDLVVEVGGAGTLERSVKATRHGGQVAVIGVLSSGPGLDPRLLLRKGVTARGIFVGSTAMLAALAKYIERQAIKPVIDRVFPFEQAADAFRHLKSATHFGKIVVRL